MKPALGVSYITRGGATIDIVAYHPGSEFPYVGVERSRKSHHYYTESGMATCQFESSYDLVSLAPGSSLSVVVSYVLDNRTRLSTSDILSLLESANRQEAHC